MLLFPNGSLITNCSVYLCNSCRTNVDSYKAVTVVIFFNIEETESQYTDSSKFNMQLTLIHGKQLSFRLLLESFHTQINMINLLFKAQRNYLVVTLLPVSCITEKMSIIFISRTYHHFIKRMGLSLSTAYLLYHVKRYCLCPKTSNKTFIRLSNTTVIITQELHSAYYCKLERTK